MAEPLWRKCEKCQGDGAVARPEFVTDGDNVERVALVSVVCSDCDGLGFVALLSSALLIEDRGQAIERALPVLELAVGFAVQGRCPDLRRVIADVLAAAEGRET